MVEALRLEVEGWEDLDALSRDANSCLRTCLQQKGLDCPYHFLHGKLLLRLLQKQRCLNSSKLPYLWSWITLVLRQNRRRTYRKSLLLGFNLRILQLYSTTTIIIPQLLRTFPVVMSLCTMRHFNKICLHDSL